MCIAVINVLVLPLLDHKVGQTKVGQFEGDVIACIACGPRNENVVGFYIVMYSSFRQQSFLPLSNADASWRYLPLVALAPLFQAWDFMYTTYRLDEL
jgi:hypothetical protein